jgi:hypothetical protein
MVWLKDDRYIQLIKPETWSGFAWLLNSLPGNAAGLN